MANTSMVDRGTYGSAFSEFVANTSQHFLFSRDPAFVSSSNDFLLSFQSHTRKIMIPFTCDPSENTSKKERVDMNSTRSSLIVDLVNGVPSGHMRERKDLIHRSYKYIGTCTPETRLSRQKAIMIVNMFL